MSSKIPKRLVPDVPDHAHHHHHDTQSRNSDRSQTILPITVVSHRITLASSMDRFDPSPQHGANVVDSDLEFRDRSFVTRRKFCGHKFCGQSFVVRRDWHFDRTQIAKCRFRLFELKNRYRYLAISALPKFQSRLTTKLDSRLTTKLDSV